MTSSPRDILHLLRQGQLIALTDETGCSVACDPQNDAAVGLLMALKAQTENPQPITVVIDIADQLGIYVAKIPEVAFEIVEYSSIPLTVMYEYGKNVSPVLWTVVNAASEGEPVTGKIAVRKSLNADVQHLIRGFTKGLLTLPFESKTLPKAAETAIQARFGELPNQTKLPRIMRLGINGDVDFVRK
jgi:L-threonylcarbamoyladenylate synthase